jgi:hypothetical protein
MSASTDRQTFRETVALVAEKAKARLPEAVNGRIEAAARLVVNGDVEPLEDGSITVGGSDPTRYYRLTGQACTCTDFVQGKAPDGWCKHRIAAGIHKRVQELLPAEKEPDAVASSDTTPLYEAPASVNCHLTISGRQVQLTLRGHDEQAVLTRLEALLARYPVAQPPAPQTASPGQSAAPITDWCPVHQVRMKLTTKNGQSRWSHYDETAGRWCKGR